MDISIVLNKCFSAGEIHWQQGDSEYVSQNKKADITYKNFCELRDQAVEYFSGLENSLITAESMVSAQKDALQARDDVIELLKSESDELKVKLEDALEDAEFKRELFADALNELSVVESKLAELEKQEPVRQYRLKGTIQWFELLSGDAPDFLDSGLFEFRNLYAQPKPAEAAQQIDLGRIIINFETKKILIDESKDWKQLLEFMCVIKPADPVKITDVMDITIVDNYFIGNEPSLFDTGRPETDEMFKLDLSLDEPQRKASLTIQNMVVMTKTKYAELQSAKPSPSEAVQAPSRDDVIQCILAIGNMSEGVLADAIIDLFNGSQTSGGDDGESVYNEGASVLDAVNAFENYVELKYGGIETNSWHDAPVDSVFIDGFNLGRQVTPTKPQRITEQDAIEIAYNALKHVNAPTGKYFADWGNNSLPRLLDKLNEHREPENKAEVPEGWKLVPIEPTIEMIAALGFGGDVYMAVGHAAICLDVEKSYKAALSVAPLPPLKDGAQ